MVMEQVEHQAVTLFTQVHQEKDGMDIKESLLLNIQHDIWQFVMLIN
jgi:hypothetical protein